MTNTPTTPSDPEPVQPDVDPVDERLSAALDGEALDQEALDQANGGLAAFSAARAPGSVGVDEAQRAADLAAARDLLAVPPPPLDDITRRRLVRVAAESARTMRERSSRSWTRIAGAAAALVLVLAVGWGIVGLAHNSSESRSSSASVTTVGNGPVVDLHDVSRPEVLLDRVRAALAPSNSSRPDASGKVPPIANTGVPSAGPATPGGGPASTNPVSPGAPSADESSCLSTLHVPAGVVPRILATATYRGLPAVVIVGRERTRVLIFVLAQSDCHLLTSQFFRG